MRPVITYAHQRIEPATTGNTQFIGRGIVKWCALCGTHKPQLGGTTRFVYGSRHWVCIKHPKAGQ